MSPLRTILYTLPSLGAAGIIAAAAGAQILDADDNVGGYKNDREKASLWWGSVFLANNGLPANLAHLMASAESSARQPQTMAAILVTLLVQHSVHALKLAVNRCDRVVSTGQWSRIVAIGDIHGDKSALEACLRSASIVDDSGRWCSDAGTLLISCGDVLDRGTEDYQCLRLLHGLKRQAQQRGGDVAMVLGNHEQLNIMGDMRFVPRAAKDDVRRACNVSRTDAFAPGGPAARLLAELCGTTPVIRKEGDTVFVHAALTVESDEEIDYINSCVTQWLIGHSDAALDGLLPLLNDVLWTRAYSDDPEAERLRRRLPEPRGYNRIVAGHNVQQNGINFFQLGRVRIYRIDTGMSRFVISGLRQTLELRVGHTPRILEPARKKRVSNTRRRYDADDDAFLVL